VVVHAEPAGELSAPRSELRPITSVPSRRESRKASALAVLLEALERITARAPNSDASVRKSSIRYDVKNSGRSSICSGSEPSS
jgi:hypothetical protein